MLADNVKSVIIQSINQWEPRIVVESIDVENNAVNANLPYGDSKQNLESFLYIKIKFSTFNNIDVVEDLTLQVPIGEA